MRGALRGYEAWTWTDARCGGVCTTTRHGLAARRSAERASIIKMHASFGRLPLVCCNTRARAISRYLANALLYVCVSLAWALMWV